MCGRYVLIATEQQIIDHFSLRRLANYQPDYNIPPGQKILNVVQLEDGSNKAVYLHWGLIPSWSKDRGIGNRLINARAETLAEKPSFRTAYRKRRCLIPATGFYEWHRTESGKQPYHIHYPDNRLFAFAGLWEHWENETETVYSCTIVTTGADAKIASIHDRMLDKARAKLADEIQAGKVSLLTADLSHLPALPECNVIIMNWTLQFVRPIERDHLLKNIYSALRPGGVLFLSEKILGNDSVLNRLYIDHYLQFKKSQSGYTDAENQRKREALENVLIPYHLDENYALLERAGFKHIDTYFRWFNFACIIAVKS